MTIEDRCLRNLVLVELLDELGWSVSRFAEEINGELTSGHVSYATVWEWVNLSRVPPWPLPPVVAHVLCRALRRPVFVHNLWSDGPAIPRSMFQFAGNPPVMTAAVETLWNVLAGLADSRGPLLQLTRAQLPFATRFSGNCANRMREADFHRSWQVRTQLKPGASGPSVSELAVPGMTTTRSTKAFKKPRELDPDRSTSRQGRDWIDARGVYHRAQSGTGG